MSSKNINRNYEIFKKFKQGVTYSELAREYGVSHSRIRQIVLRILEQNRKEKTDILEITQACEEKGVSKNLNSRIQNKIRNAHLQKTWRRLSVDDLKNVYGIGNLSIDIIVHAQKIARKHE